MHTVVLQSHECLPAQPTWARAKQWLDTAVKFEQCKLHAQVMLGFELLALRKIFAPKSGPSTNGDAPGWVDTVERELGLKHTTAYRFEQMARAVAEKRLEHISALRGVDLLSTPVASLTERQSLALTKCVHRITDQKTQQDFLEELGMADSAAEARAKGGDNDYRRWVRNMHPELLDGVGIVPSRGRLHREHPAIYAEWQAFRKGQKAERAARAPTLTQQIALANARVAAATHALLEVADDAHAGICEPGRLQALVEAARHLLDYAKTRKT